MRQPSLSLSENEMFSPKDAREDRSKQERPRRCYTIPVLVAVLIAAVLAVIAAVIIAQHERLYRCSTTTTTPNEQKPQGEKVVKSPTQVQPVAIAQMTDEKKSSVSRTKRSECEPVTIAMCQNVPYKLTRFPNALQHGTQKQAARDILRFSRLVTSGCSPLLTTFLCSVYAPPCDESHKVIPPCKELCHRATKSCKGLVNRLGVPWPSKLRCKRFPKQGQSPCLKVSVAKKTPPLPAKCQSLTIPVCRGLRSNFTQFPNVLGHKNQSQANVGLTKFAPLLKAGCSAALPQFLCSVYAPPCRQSDAAEPPCREFCELTRKDCRSVIKETSFDWPAELKCKIFPRRGKRPCRSRAINNALSRSSQRECEALRMPICRGLSYNMTVFPNSLNHRTQEEAALEVHQFYPLIQINCSSDLTMFLCSMYAPMCTILPRPVPPCRELCARVKDACLPYLLKFGFSWPAKFDCHQFPTSVGEAICVRSSSATPVPTTATPPHAVAKMDTSIGTRKCEELRIPLCRETQQYNSTLFPNAFNHTTQDEAALEVHQFYPLIQLNCSSDLSMLLCSLYAPICTIHLVPVPPCREFCTGVKDACLPYLIQFGFTWPAQLACDQFPTLGEAVCVDASLTTPITTDATAPVAKTNNSTGTRKCEELRVPLCRETQQYNSTLFPNVFNHTTQDEAALEVHQFYPLIQLNCSSDLTMLLCSLYAPVCTIHLVPVPPCRELCTGVKDACLPYLLESGFSWPTQFACDQFPTLGEAVCIGASLTTAITTDATTPVAKTDTSTRTGKCEELRIPLCRETQQYNSTLFPNAFNHTTQDEAALEGHQFFLMVQLNCSSDLTMFLCSLYAPICTIHLTPVPPCRELCTRVKDACLPYLLEFGVSWPTQLACDQYPTLGEAVCVGASLTTAITTDATTPVAKTDTSTGTGTNCQPLTSSVCNAYKYNSTQFPNVLGHKDQSQANVALMTFAPLLKAGCSRVLRRFLCSVYTPPCRQSDAAVPPCREFCELARKDCRSVMKEASFKWPRELKCKHFPRKGEQPCDSGQSFIEAPTRPSEIECEPVRVPICQGLPYNSTTFPNSFNHATQEEAALEVHQFYPLIKIECSSYLTLFLCSLYAPICTDHLASVPPCRELCTHVRDGCYPIMKKFGFSWPDKFVCDKFPKSEEGGICIGVPLSARVNTAPPTIGKTDTLSGKREKCKPVTFPACRDLKSNFTQFPNVLGHKDQSQANVGLKTFAPLLKAGCSRVLPHFLCSVYTPPCRQSDAAVPPCREFCELARKDCRSVIKKTGFDWPRDLKCRHFPRKGEQSCDSGAFIDTPSHSPQRGP